MKKNTKRSKKISGGTLTNYTIIQEFNELTNLIKNYIDNIKNDKNNLQIKYDKISKRYSENSFSNLLKLYDEGLIQTTNQKIGGMINKIHKLRKISNKNTNLKIKNIFQNSGISKNDIKSELNTFYKKIHKGGNYQYIVNQFLKTTRIDKNNEVVSKHYKELLSKITNNFSGKGSPSETRDILNQIYIAALGKQEEQLTISEKKYIDKNLTQITELNKKILEILSNCDTEGIFNKFEVQLTNFQNKTNVINKLFELLQDQKIRETKGSFLIIDLPTNIKHIIQSKYKVHRIDWDAKPDSKLINMIISSLMNNIYSDILTYTDEMKTSLSYIENNIDINDNERKKKVCNHIDLFKQNLKAADKIPLDYIINKYEDISGSVRVYVRINDFSQLMKEKEKSCKRCLGRSFEVRKELISDNKGNQQLVETKDIIIKNPCSGDIDFDINNKLKEIKNKEIIENNTYRNFFGTFEGISNKELYTGIYGKDKKQKLNGPGLGNALMQVKDGYSVIVFGYGYSGSGKSYTLLNGTDNMLGSTLKNVLNLGGKISIHKIFELYGMYNFNNKKLESEIIDITNYIKKKVDLNKFSDINEFQKILDTMLFSINQLRTENRRIKGTPNNPESSRSHLFITVKTEFDNKTPGYLTIVDMAGIENPYEIGLSLLPVVELESMFVDPKNSTIWKKIDKNVNSFLIEKKKQYGKRLPEKTFINGGLEFTDKFDAKDQLFTKSRTYALFNKVKKIMNNSLDNDKIKIEKINFLLNYFKTGRNIKDETFKWLIRVINIKTLKEKYDSIIDYVKRVLIYLGILDELSGIKNKQIKWIGTTKKMKLYEDITITIDPSSYYEIVNEGVYINETINHLSYYFKNKNKVPGTIIELTENDIYPGFCLHKKCNVFIKQKGIDIDYKKYESNRFIIDPRQKQKKIINLTDINDPIKINSILDYLGNLGDPKKPSKYIMLCLIRSEIETKYCNGARASLEFARRVKST